MAKETNKSIILKNMLTEMVKTYVSLDGQGRPEFVYQARASATNGEVCLVTQNVYASPTSTVIIGVKEAEGVWDSSWDANFTI